MFTLDVPPESPCGCESGKLFGECCLTDGRIALKPKFIKPPGAITRRRLRRCLLANSANCGGGISGDHVISASVLRQIAADKITIAGSRFSHPVAIHSDSLKVKRLCRRHNSALSPLDDEAARLFRAVQVCERALAGIEASPLRFFLFDGFDIERWLTKTLFGAYYAKLSNVAAPEYELPPYAPSLFDAGLPPPYGLYIPVKQEGDRMYSMVVGRHASLNLITEGKFVAGIQVSIGGLEMRFIIGGSPEAISLEAARGLNRPKFINLFKGNMVYTIALAWMDGPDRVVWLSRDDATAPLPRN